MSWSVDGYQPGRELGGGATGRVFLATHESTGTPVAIKYLSDELRADIPILLVTGHRERQTDVRAVRAGIIEILDKPLRAGALREALGRAFAAAH